MPVDDHPKHEQNLDQFGNIDPGREKEYISDKSIIKVTCDNILGRQPSIKLKQKDVEALFRDVK